MADGGGVAAAVLAWLAAKNWQQRILSDQRETIT
jgi:hypothetical protein